jgi:hypothetical protein
LVITRSGHPSSFERLLLLTESLGDGAYETPAKNAPANKTAKDAPADKKK